MKKQNRYKPKRISSDQSQPVSLQSLFRESDKGCVTIIGSVMEVMLRQIHEVRIAVSTFQSRTDIFNKLYRPYAPLCSFAGLIQIGFAYGLIKAEDYKDLEHIRALRNEAAHSLFDYSLEDEGIKSHVLQLTADARANKTSRKAKALANWSGSCELPNTSKTKRVLILNTLALRDNLSKQLEKELRRLILLRQKTKSE